MLDQVPDSLLTYYQELQVAIRNSRIIFVSGFPNVGKTTLAKKALKDSQNSVFAIVDCNSCQTQLKLYQSVIDQLNDQIRLRSKDECPKFIRSIGDFFGNMEWAIDTAKKKRKKIFLIIDRVELYRKTDMIDILLALATTPNLGMIMVSDEPVREFIDCIKVPTHRNVSCDGIYEIKVPPLDRSDILKDLKPGLKPPHPELYTRFINNAVSLLHNSTKDCAQMRSFCRENYDSFVAYSTRELKECIRNFEGKDSIEELDSDENAIANYEIQNHHLSRITKGFLELLKSKVRENNVASKDANVIDRAIPNETSILLISAHIASNTRPSDDKKNFVRFQKRSVKRSKIETDGDRRAFTQERLLQICRSVNIIMKGIESSARKQAVLPDSVMGDLSRLVELGLIQVIAGDQLSPLTRYKLSECVSKDYIEQLAQNIDFDLNSLFGL